MKTILKISLKLSNIIFLIFGPHFNVIDQTLKIDHLRITLEVLLQTNLMVCVSKYSPLADNKKIGPEELIRQPLVIQNEKFAERFWNKLFLDYGKGTVVFYSNNHEFVIKINIPYNIATGSIPNFGLKITL